MVSFKRYPTGHNKTGRGSGYQSHNGKREMARRVRQQARNLANQIERGANWYTRGGVGPARSRRGHVVEVEA